MLYNKNPISIESQQILDLLIAHSGSQQNWQDFLVPFTLKDLEGIKGRGGGPTSVSLGLHVQVSIILSHLCAFIIQRKVQGLSPSFSAEDLLNYVMNVLRHLIDFGEETRKAIRTKLNLFLNVVAGVCTDLGISLLSIETTGNYRITVRNTKTLKQKVAQIEENINNKLNELRTQRSIREFM
jgi:hypothetical protein